MIFATSITSGGHVHIVVRQKGERAFANFELQDGQSVLVHGMHLQRSGVEIQIKTPRLFGLVKKTIALHPGSSITIDGHLFFAGTTDHAVLRFISYHSFDLD